MVGDGEGDLSVMRYVVHLVVDAVEYRYGFGECGSGEQKLTG